MRWPPDRCAGWAAGCCREAGIPLAVQLSSDLVGSYPGSVMAASHQREETVLGAVLGGSLAVLRPGMFMNNDAAEWSASIRDDGKVITAFPDALEVPIAAVTVLTEVLKRPITIVEVSAEEHVALLARQLPEPIARQKLAMRAEAPRSIADCPDVPLGKERTRYAAWAAANVAAFGVEGR
jgi:hypothetical protein